MATLNGKNLPDDLYEKLKARARRERRPVAQEVTGLLAAALEIPRALSMIDLQGRWRGALAGCGWRGACRDRTCIMGLMDDLGSGRAGVDTAIFIYFIDAAPIWLTLITPLFRAADSGRVELVTSSVTLLDVPVVPFRVKNDALAARYDALLTRCRAVRLIDVTRVRSRLASRLASRLRAATGMRTPGALQLCAAREAGCSVFLTNGRRLPTVPGPRIL